MNGGAVVQQLPWHPGVLVRAPQVVMLLAYPERMSRELGRMTRHWRAEVLPRYRRTVAEAGRAPRRRASRRG